MASHLHFHTPSTRGLLLTKVSIVFVVMVTGLVSAVLVRSQLERHEIQADPIPIADITTWDDLKR